jgi:hypothetical protein
MRAYLSQTMLNPSGRDCGGKWQLCQASLFDVAAQSVQKPGEVLRFEIEPIVQSWAYAAADDFYEAEAGMRSANIGSENGLHLSKSRYHAMSRLRIRRAAVHGLRNSSARAFSRLSQLLRCV